MKVKDYKNIYTHCAVNIGYHLLDFCDDILCYGSSFSVVLYSLKVCYDGFLSSISTKFLYLLGAKSCQSSSKPFR